jgi:uncharacterized membrane protein YfcA
VLLIAGLGFGSAFLSGLVGVGGAIILIPALTYVPPLFGMAPLGIKAIAGVTLVQVAAAGALGAWRHHRVGAVRRTLVVPLGISMAVASLLGAIASDLVEAWVLEAIFATMAIVAAVALVTRSARPQQPVVADGDIAADRPTAIAMGGGLGLLSGLVGVGGSFLLVPMMVEILRVPLRIAIGTSLAVVTIAATAGAFGKAVTGQVDWTLAAALVVGALPGVVAGAYASRRTATGALTWVLTAIVLFAGIRMWIDVITQF